MENLIDLYPCMEWKLNQALYIGLVAEFIHSIENDPSIPEAHKRNFIFQQDGKVILPFLIKLQLIEYSLGQHILSHLYLSTQNKMAVFALSPT